MALQSQAFRAIPNSKRLPCRTRPASNKVRAGNTSARLNWC
jgi:hypothetical protein